MKDRPEVDMCDELLYPSVRSTTTTTTATKITEENHGPIVEDNETDSIINNNEDITIKKIATYY